MYRRHLRAAETSPLISGNLWSGSVRICSDLFNSGCLDLSIGGFLLAVPLDSWILVGSISLRDILVDITIREGTLVYQI